MRRTLARFGRRLDPTKADPILMLVGAIVTIDALAPRTITSVLRKNRAEAYILTAWFLVHISKETTR